MLQRKTHQEKHIREVKPSKLIISLLSLVANQCGVEISVGCGDWRWAWDVEIGVEHGGRRWAWDVEIAVGHGFPAFGSDLGGGGGGEIGVAVGDFLMVG